MDAAALPPAVAALIAVGEPLAADHVTAAAAARSADLGRIRAACSNMLASQAGFSPALLDYLTINDEEPIGRTLMVRLYLPGCVAIMFPVATNGGEWFARPEFSVVPPYGRSPRVNSLALTAALARKAYTSGRGPVQLQPLDDQPAT